MISRTLARAGLALVVLLPTPGCLTDAALRVAQGHDDVRSVEAAAVDADGGLLVAARLALGTARSSRRVLAIGREELEAAHAAAGEHVALDRACVREGGGEALDGAEPVTVVRLDPWEFGWEREDVAALRPPKGERQAVFFEPPFPISRHLRRMRIVHVRVEPSDAAGDTERTSAAVFELRPDPDSGKAVAWVALPVTATVDFFVVSLTAGFVLGFAGLAL